MAAVLACGEGALLSHRSALAQWGAAPAARGRPSVTTPKRRRAQAGIDLHTSRTLAGDDAAVVDNIPCTSVARTLLDFADDASDAQLRRAVDECERLRIFNGNPTQAVLARANGRRGAARLRAVLDAWSEPPLLRSWPSGASAL